MDHCTHQTLAAWMLNWLNTMIRPLSTITRAPAMMPWAASFWPALYYSWGGSPPSQPRGLTSLAMAL
jgi:hypothetical protein